MYVNRADITPAPCRPVIAIVGGGYSGAAVAWHLAHGATEAEIVVFEPRPDLGRGLAYSTPDPDHRLNVPDHRMTLVSADPLHFRTWLASSAAPSLPPGSATLAGEVFAPRAVFGQYVAAHLATALEAGRITHRRETVTGITTEAGRYLLQGSSGDPLAADVVVLAVSHPPPALPAELANLAGDAALTSDVAVPGALAAIAPQDRVLIVGSGLTAADILATLARQGQRGAVHLLSRHGWRSQPHGPKQPETTADFATVPATTALALLRRVRAALRADAACGLTWHPVFDRLRAQGPAIWAALPQPERKRFLRHLRALWDIHRFRIAPQTHATLQRAERDKRAFFHAARIIGAQRKPRGIEVTIRPRGKSELAHLTVDRVVLATGPAHGQVIAGNPALAALAALGLVQPDPLRLGLATAQNGQAVGVAGPVPGLFVAGPLARGTMGELMGVPEVTAWAEHVAVQIRAALPQIAAQPG
ncbi:Uncharacterized NAD(P)/FAD-binding protein YdhS [Gemmobacter aquatilis]|uniref:Uncharacterized NAD(P)/FAD-binding protein YdhS n=1 Tax=Gemmobacter aquatilis TaxID=933059 RepID=A0A1H7Y1H8_9RHOB|nr:FAD/NAD(P)-binding protein [Gemmobacter aquatilis]SEM40056.1 Uncharacterized NAD(P)/FAD-binding protein YdhS [Gemmobacter aquatilis]